jgi:CHASE3 domain sensor protein
MKLTLYPHHFLTNVSIVTKLALSAVVAGTTMAALIAVMWLSVNALDKAITTALAERAPQLRYAIEAQLHFSNAAINEKNVLLSDNPAAVTNYAKLYRSYVAKAKAAIALVREHTHRQDRLDLLNAFEQAVDDRAANSDEVFKYAAGGDIAKATELSQVKGKAARLRALDASQKLAGLFQSDLDAARTDVEVLQSEARKLTVIAGAVGFLISAGILLWISGVQVARPITRIATAMQKLARGDTSVEIVDGARSMRSA